MPTFKAGESKWRLIERLGQVTATFFKFATRNQPIPNQARPRAAKWLVRCAPNLRGDVSRQDALGQPVFRRRSTRFLRGHCLPGLAFASGNLDSKAALRNR
jgi:hypothetical protein